jgi:hypothetical protein
MRALCIYVNKDVRIRDYFSKPKGAGDQKRLLNTFQEFDVHVTVRRDKFLTIKPTRRTNSTNLFWIETLHVSDSSSVHHQEFFTVHTAMVYVVQVCCLCTVKNS